RSTGSRAVRVAIRAGGAGGPGGHTGEVLNQTARAGFGLSLGNRAEHNPVSGEIEIAVVELKQREPRLEHVRVFLGQVERVQVAAIPVDVLVAERLDHGCAVIRLQRTTERTLLAGLGVHVITIPLRVFHVVGTEAENSSQTRFNVRLRATVEVVDVERAIERVVSGK